MKKLTIVVVVLLICAMVFGVGGVLLYSESNKNVEETPVFFMEPGSTAYFECPPDNPNCEPNPCVGC